MDRKLLIYVENISPSSNEEQLTAYLEKWAPVLQVCFLKEKQCTKRSLAAFVRVGSEDDLELLLQRNQQNYRGKRLFMLRADKPQFFQADETIIVRNITSKMSEEVLYDHFAEVGNITFLQVRTDDFAYVQFENKVAAKNAMGKNNMPLKNVNLKTQLLTRNLEIMIVNLDTLSMKMPQLYHKLCMPIEPRSAGQKVRQSEPEPDEEPQHQQQNQAPQKQQQQERQAPHQQQQRQQSQQQRQQPQQQRQQQQQQQRQQQQQQRQQPQQQRQQPQQQRQQPQQQRQQQQNQNAHVVQQRPQFKQQQQVAEQQAQPVQQMPPKPQREPRQQSQSTVQTLTEKANSSAEQQQPAAQSENLISYPISAFNGQKVIASVPDVIVLDPETSTPTIEIDENDGDVQIVEKSIPPIPSKYVTGANDLIRPIKASDIGLIDAEAKDPSDRRSVWVNNIPPETTREEMVDYLEQFGNIENVKLKPSSCCFFTKWAKVIYCNVESAVKASEYFLHPFNGHYLFVLSCTRCVDETPERCFVIDYLSRYITYEEVFTAFKHVGEVFYLVRLFKNTFKTRIFFLGNVSAEAVLAVKSINGIPINMEPFSKGMMLKNAKSKIKEFRLARDSIDEEKALRLEKINVLNQKEFINRVVPIEYNNPDSKKSPVEVVLHNVPKLASDEQITKFLKGVGQPTSIRRFPAPYENETEQVYVGFDTFSKALSAIKIAPESVLAGNNPFIFLAWNTAMCTEQNTLRMLFSELISIQSIYKEVSVFGRVRFIQKENAKQALVVFYDTDTGAVASATNKGLMGLTSIAGVKIIKTAHYLPKTGISKNDGPIVIDDEDDDVVVSNQNAPNVHSQKHGPKQNHGQKQNQGPKQNQGSNQNQRQQQNQRQAQNQQRQGQNQQRQPQNQRQQQNQRQNQYQRQQPNQRQQQNQRQQFQQQRSGGGWQGSPQQRGQPVNPWNDPNFCIDDQAPWQNNQFNSNNQFDMGRNMDQFDQMQMQMQNNQGFDRYPMDMDDPPLDGWGPPQQFNRNRGNEGIDCNRDFDIPPNISEDDIDEYIMRKQQAIERRLEQLDKQLISSAEGGRGRRQDDGGFRRRKDIVFSDNGDVHYVPNPAARFRGGQGRARNRNAGGFNRDNRSNRDSSYRHHDPFADIETIPVVRISEERSPSPKRTRNSNEQEEDEFDADRFNAAWS